MEYEEIKDIGAGAFGQVFLVRRKSDNNLFVMKKVKKTDSKKEEKEIVILKKLDHPYIVQYIGSFYEGTKLCIVMELMNKGDLKRLINFRKEKNWHFEENDILLCVVNIALAIKYIKDNNIIHRDLKPENLFLCEYGIVKIGDFGISRQLSSESEKARTQAGTLSYEAPEIRNRQPYDNKVDVWSFGCIIHEMCCLEKTFKREQFNEHDLIPDMYSSELNDIIESCLQIDPNERCTIEDVLLKPVVREYVMNFYQQSDLRISTALLINYIFQMQDVIKSQYYFKIQRQFHDYYLYEMPKLEFKLGNNKESNYSLETLMKYFRTKSTIDLVEIGCYCLVAKDYHLLSALMKLGLFEMNFDHGDFKKNPLVFGFCLVACTDKRVDLRCLISLGVDVSVKSESGFNALHYIFNENKFDKSVVKLLIENGCDINAVSNILVYPTPLLCAILGGNLEAVKFLIESGCFIDNNDHPIIRACMAGQLDIVKYFISNGCDVNILDHNQRNPFLASVFSENLKLISYLLEQNCNTNQVDKFGLNAFTAAALRNAQDVISMLLEKGIDMDIKDSSTLNDIKYSLREENMHNFTPREENDIIAMLVRYYILDQQDEKYDEDNIFAQRYDKKIDGLLLHVVNEMYHLCCGHSAILIDNTPLPPDVIDKELQNYSEEFRDRIKKVLYLDPNFETLEQFSSDPFIGIKFSNYINAHDDDKFNWCLLYRYMSKIQTLYDPRIVSLSDVIENCYGLMKREKSADKEHRDKNFAELYDFNSLEEIYNYIDKLFSNDDNSFGSALAFKVQHYCDENGQTILHLAGQKNNLQMIERFFNIEKQFDKDKDGNTPLEIAELNGHNDLVEKFYEIFEHTIDLDDLQSPLRPAILLGSPALISLLCERKKEKCYAEYENFDPVIFAARIGETKCIERLLALKFKKDYKDEDGRDALFYSAFFCQPKSFICLIENGANISILDNNGYNVLEIAAFKNCLEIVQYIVELCERKKDRSNDINYQSKDGFTALHAAAQGNAKQVAEFLMNLKCELNKFDENGLTALHIAAKFGSTEVFKFLAENGFDINEKTNGENPQNSFKIAFDTGNYDIVQYIGTKFYGWKSDGVT